MSESLGWIVPDLRTWRIFVREKKRAGHHDHRRWKYVLIPQTSLTCVCKGIFTQEMNVIIVDGRATTKRRGKLIFRKITVLNFVLERKLFAPEIKFLR